MFPWTTSTKKRDKREYAMERNLAPFHDLQTFSSDNSILIVVSDVNIDITSSDIRHVEINVFYDFKNTPFKKPTLLLEL